MKILVAHNRYQQPGGEDQVVAAETALLLRNGHDVEQLIFDNDGITGLATQLRTAADSIFSREAYTHALDRLRAFRPDVLHVHNFMPRLSPSIFFAARRAGVAVVHTVHNYRMVCANALLFRNGKVCEDCLEMNSFLPGVQHACYRGSRLGTAIVGGGIALHEQLGTWTRQIDRYIVLTEFAKGKLTRSALPGDRVRVKPNFVADRGIGSGDGGYLLFVGRLSEEKGVRTLLEVDRMGRLPFPLVLVGDGPLRSEVQQACRRPGSMLKMVGRQSGPDVLRWMKAATALLVPSACYEGFPMAIAEALSVGLPVIASQIGGLPEIVVDQRCGLFHTPSDPRSLCDAITALTALQSVQLRAMRNAARERYLTEYSEAPNHRRLIHIYSEAIAAAERASVPCAPEALRQARAELDHCARSSASRT